MPSDFPWGLKESPDHSTVPALSTKSLHFLLQDCSLGLITPELCLVYYRDLSDKKVSSSLIKVPSDLCDITGLCLVEWWRGGDSIPGNIHLGQILVDWSTYA